MNKLNTQHFLNKLKMYNRWWLLVIIRKICSPMCFNMKILWLTLQHKNVLGIFRSYLIFKIQLNKKPVLLSCIKMSAGLESIIINGINSGINLEFTTNRMDSGWLKSAKIQYIHILKILSEISNLKLVNFLPKRASIPY